MRKQRRFSAELKCQVIEELLSGKKDLRNLVDAIISPQVSFTTGKSNTAGVSSATNRVLCPPPILCANDPKGMGRRRWVKTTQSDHPYPVLPNVIRNLVTTSVGQVWLADITYIRILTAFVYLALILDMLFRAGLTQN